MAEIPAPLLDTRDEEQIAAEMIARVSGDLTLAAIDKGIEVWRRLREIVESGVAPVPACPELTNANPSAAHTAFIEAVAMVAAFQSYKLNQVPDQNKVAFHRLFGIELRPAAAAAAALEFTSGAPAGVAVTVPAGTLVADEGGQYTFATDEELIIPEGEATGTVTATRTTPGATSLGAGMLTRLVDLVAYVEAVTNPAAVESGADAETVESALARARSYQRRAERLVSAQDLEDAIVQDVLRGNGVVRVFPNVKDGDWQSVSAGHTTVVVMTRSGTAVGDDVRQAISSLLTQSVGAPFIYVKDPTPEPFTVQASVRIAAFTTQAAVKAAVESALRAFYAPSRGNLGRAVLRSEIIALVEGTAGVTRIEPQPGGAILAAPLADVELAPWQLPALGAVTINVVQ